MNLYDCNHNELEVIKEEVNVGEMLISVYELWMCFNCDTHSWKKYGKTIDMEIKIGEIRCQKR